MSIDLKLEMAKNEYVNAINTINNKYDLEASLVEIIMKNLLSQVSAFKQAKIEKDLIEYNNSKKEDLNEKESTENVDSLNSEE